MLLRPASSAARKRLSACWKGVQRSAWEGSSWEGCQLSLLKTMTQWVTVGWVGTCREGGHQKARARDKGRVVGGGRVVGCLLCSNSAEGASLEAQNYTFEPRSGSDGARDNGADAAPCDD